MIKKEMQKILNFKMDKKTKKKAFKTAAVLTAGIVCMLGPSLAVNASGFGGTDTSVVTESFDTLYDIVAAVISSLGLIITLWGISEMGMSYQGTDGIMQAQSLKRIGGGLIMIVAPNILPLLT